MINSRWTTFKLDGQNFLIERVNLMRIYFELAQMSQAQSGRSEGMKVDGPTLGGKNGSR